jgi:hypothetical protein
MVAGAGFVLFLQYRRAFACGNSIQPIQPLLRHLRMTGLPESGRSHLVKTAKIDICFRLV